MKVLFLSLFPFLLSAQSVFIDQGSTTSVGVSIGSIGSSSVVSLGLSHSFNARTDMSVSVSHATNSNIDNLYEFIANFGIGHYLIKQDDDTPISFGLRLSYAYHSLGGDYLQGISATGSTGAFNASIAHKADASDKFSIVPFASIGYKLGEIEVDYIGQNLGDFDNTGIIGSIGISGVIKTDQGMLTISPNVIFNRGQKGFQLSLGYVL